MLSSWMSLPFTHVRKRLFLSSRSALSSHEFQLFFHVCSTDLGVANGGLDGWGPFHGHMPQIIGDLFQRPASLAGTMRKIMAQIMKRESSDEFPFLVVGLPLEAPEPLVNAIFGETRTPLGRKDVGTRALTPAMLEVVIQGATCLVQQRSEEHTSELQSRFDLVCRLLLEKKKRQKQLLCVHENRSCDRASLSTMKQLGVS